MSDNYQEESESFFKNIAEKFKDDFAREMNKLMKKNYIEFEKMLQKEYKGLLNKLRSKTLDEFKTTYQVGGKSSDKQVLTDLAEMIFKSINK